MIIQSIELKNFRNYRELKLIFDKKTTIFKGMHREIQIFWKLFI